MKKLIVIIDLHCDASMPSGAEEFGGGNMYSRNLIKCLQQINVQFIYITRKKFPYLEERVCLENNSIFYRLDLGDFGYNDKDILQKYEEISFQKINEIVEEFAKDSQLIFHSLYWQSGVIAYRLSMQYQTYFVHSVLSNAERKKLQDAVSDIAPSRIKSEHIIYDAAKYIICSSKSEYEDMLSLYHLPKNKLHITGRWIAQSYRTPVYYPNGMVRTHELCPAFPIHYINCYNEKHSCKEQTFWSAKSFIYFGRIHPNKGLPQIIEAWLNLFEYYKSDMPALWIIGGTPHQIFKFREQYIKTNKLLASAEKEGKIIWWGTLSTEGISTLLLKCHAVIMHSKYEAGGIIVVEAMSQGIPLIATPFGFAKDFIEDGVNGYMVQFNDLNSLAEKMKYFINQPYLSNYLGRNARHKSAEILSNWHFIDLHLSLYGIEIPHTNIMNQHLACNKIYKNSVDIYPYCFEMPDPAYIKHISSEVLGSIIINVTIMTSEQEYVEWKIDTHNDFFYFYYLYPLLNVESMNNGKKPYVFDSSYRVRQILSLLSKDIVKHVDETKGYLLLNERLELPK